MLTSGSGTRGLAPIPAISCGKEGKEPPPPQETQNSGDHLQTVQIPGPTSW